MKQRNSILQILKTITLIPLIIVLAIIAAIYAIVQKGKYDCKQGEKIIKRRIEILLSKNPMLIQNLNKISISIFDMFKKSDNESVKYITRLSLTNKSINLDLDDNSKSENIKLKVYAFEIDGEKLLKDCTGFSNIDDFIESLGYDKEYYDIDEIDGEEVDKIKSKIKYIIDIIELINFCIKEQYKSVFKLDYTFE